MPARHARMWLGWFVVASALVMLAVDGEVSRTEALDRWVGTLTISANGVTAVLDFIVVIDPGTSASFEWRFRGVLLASGPLSATVSGSYVSGTMYFTGGLITQTPGCCVPCNFTGTIAGNSASGTGDPTTCGADGGTWVLVKR